MSKKLEEKQQRREAEERKKQELQRAARKRNLLTFGIAALVGALVVFLIINDRNSGGGGGSSVDAGVAKGEAGCSDIERTDPEGQNHVEDGTDVQYATTPSTGGDHYATPADAGFHETELPEEQVTHNMEHGQIIVWYDPDAPESTIDAIRSVVEDDAIALLAVPFSDIPSGSELTFTAWGAMESCADFSNDVFSEFRAEFQGRGPENVGIPTFDPSDA